MIIKVTSLPFKNIPAVPLPCTTNAKRKQRNTHIVLRFIQKCICKTICKSMFCHEAIVPITYFT